MNLPDINRDSIMHQTKKSVVLSLTNTEVAKITIPNSKRLLEIEADNLKYANSINDLMVKFIRIDLIGEYNVLVMERIYPMEFRAFDFQQRKKFADDFENKFKQLNDNGFCIIDLPTFESFSRPLHHITSRHLSLNFALTSDGVRLLDAGSAVLKSDVGATLFERFRTRDQDALSYIQQYLLYNPDPIVSRMRGSTSFPIS